MCYCLFYFFIAKVIKIAGATGPTAIALNGRYKPKLRQEKSGGRPRYETRCGLPVFYRDHNPLSMKTSLFYSKQEKAWVVKNGSQHKGESEANKSLMICYSTSEVLPHYIDTKEVQISDAKIFNRMTGITITNEEDEEDWVCIGENRYITTFVQLS